MKRVRGLGLVLAVSALALGQGAPPVNPEYEKYVHDAIPQPFPDLLVLGIPQEVAGQPLAPLGYVDVTQPPFSADASGLEDCTKALQAAIDFARDHQMACFFPPGTYRISDTLQCIEQLYRQSNGRVFGGNRFANLLVGSTAGGARPKILLAPRSPGFDHPDQPKIVLYFWARGYLNLTTSDRVGDGLSPESEQPNISMNQMLLNLQVAIGEGNPGAVVVRHQAAEGSAIENCVIDATGGHTGLQGGIGSGGGSSGVTVLGGRFGLDFTGYMGGTQPTPTITGFTLQGQTEAAILSSSRQALVATGLKIVADRSAGPLIQVSDKSGANTGQLSLSDSTIEFSGDAMRQPERVAIASQRGVFLHRVYVKGATKVVEGQGPETLAGNPSGWIEIEDFAATAPPMINQEREYHYPVYVDRKPVDVLSRTKPDAEPPADLQSRHLPMEPFPSFQTAGVVNVKEAPYNASGDGTADDTEALQRAIDEHEAVFLPKGAYRLSRTLNLRPNTKLIGVGQHLSFLYATGEGEFADAAQPAPLVRTADTDQAATVLAFLSLWAPRDHPGVAMLDWRCGGRSVFRSVELRDLFSYGFGKPPSWPLPEQSKSALVVVQAHGGGRWYNYRGERIRIDGASGPLRFYQFSPQQVTSQIVNAGEVAIYGTKYEGNGPMLIVRDCDQVAIFGHGGNAKGRTTNPLFVFERTPNILFANGVDGPTRIGTKGASHRDGSTDPRLWHFLSDDDFQLPVLERPVLYLTGKAWSP